MRKSGIRVHEDGEGQIHVTGLKTRQIHSLQEVGLIGDSSSFDLKVLGSDPV